MPSVFCTNIETSPKVERLKYRNPNFAEMDKQFGYKNIVLKEEVKRTLQRRFGKYYFPAKVFLFLDHFLKH